MSLLRTRRPVVGMVHLLPLPGSPRARSLDEVLARALADARALAAGGADGILVENFGDAPFFPGPVEPHVVACMTAAARAVREETGLPLGINVLRNDARSALGVALASGAEFIRVNVHTGAAFADQGLIEGRAHETLRVRKAIGSSAAIFADVLVKHARPAGSEDAAVAARDAARRGLADVLLVTGVETGAAPDEARLQAVQRAVPERPVWVASGVSLRTAEALGAADGFIVGSAFKRGGRAESAVDPARVAALVRLLKGRRKVRRG